MFNDATPIDMLTPVARFSNSADACLNSPRIACATSVQSPACESFVQAAHLWGGWVRFDEARNRERVIPELHNVVGRALADRFLGDLSDVFAGDPDDWRRTALLDRFEQLHPRAVGQVVVRQ